MDGLMSIFTSILSIQSQMNTYTHLKLNNLRIEWRYVTHNEHIQSKIYVEYKRGSTSWKHHIF